MKTTDLGGLIIGGLNNLLFRECRIFILTAVSPHIHGGPAGAALVGFHRSAKRALTAFEREGWSPMYDDRLRYVADLLDVEIECIKLITSLHSSKGYATIDIARALVRGNMSWLADS